jgi:hypothetical protein
MSTPDTMTPLVSSMVTAMRISARLRKRRGARIARWAFATLALCGFIPDAVAGDLVQRMSSLWVAATALSLTLVTAVSRPQK